MLLISIEQMLSFKASQMIPLKCDSCQQNFERMQKYIKSNLKLRSYKNHYCSNACQNKLNKTKKEVNCKQCNKIVFKDLNQLKKYPILFAPLHALPLIIILTKLMVIGDQSSKCT